MSESLDSLLWHIPDLPDEITGNTEINIIDTCIDVEHIALQGKIVDHDYIEYCKEKMKVVDLNSKDDIHGTCMAGIIGAKETLLKCANDYYKEKYPYFKVQGVAKESYFKPIADYPSLAEVKKILNFRNVGETSSGTKYFPVLKRTEITVINLSGGETGTAASEDWPEFMKRICKGESEADNHIIIASAGNEGLDLKSSPSHRIYPASTINPKACRDINIEKQIISVACLGKYDYNSTERELCTKSNYSNKYVDIAAPGQNIPCPFPGNVADMPTQGTSQAVSVVSGTIALLKGCDPYASAKQIIDVLFEYSDKIPSLEAKVKDGKVLNIEKSVRAFCFNMPEEENYEWRNEGGHGKNRTMKSEL